MYCDVASIPCYLQVEYRMQFTIFLVPLPGKGATLTNRDRFPQLRGSLVRIDLVLSGAATTNGDSTESTRLRIYRTTHAQHIIINTN